MRNTKTAFMQRQERTMDERRKQDDTTQDSINVRIAKLLGWRVMIAAVGRWALLNPDGVAIYRYGANEAAAWQHVPDCKHSVDATLATLDPRRDITFESDYDGVLQACLISALTIDENASRGEGTTRADAAAHALEALLLARQATAQASQEAGTGDA